MTIPSPVSVPVGFLQLPLDAIPSTDGSAIVMVDGQQCIVAANEAAPTIAAWGASCLACV